MIGSILRGSRRALLGGAVALLLTAVAAGPAWAQSRNLAPGFVALPAQQSLAVMPVDIELFSLSAGGLPSPRADWTSAAQGFMNDELRRRLTALQLEVKVVDENAADDFAEQISLHAAVARSINLHHGSRNSSGVWALPSKDGRLDWSFGDAMQPLQTKLGTRYGLFVWVRDSYASNERKAAMFALALLGVGITGGVQVGYASLVDLQTGQVLWFNSLERVTGDLREQKPAAESIDALLANFPAVR
jgi:hypothetical protein